MHVGGCKFLFYKHLFRDTEASRCSGILCADKAEMLLCRDLCERCCGAGEPVGCGQGVLSAHPHPSTWDPPPHVSLGWLAGRNAVTGFLCCSRENMLFQHTLKRGFNQYHPTFCCVACFPLRSFWHSFARQIQQADYVTGAMAEERDIWHWFGTAVYLALGCKSCLLEKPPWKILCSRYNIATLLSAPYNNWYGGNDINENNVNFTQTAVNKEKTNSLCPLLNWTHLKKKAPWLFLACWLGVG